MRYLLKHKKFGTNADTDEWYEFQSQAEWHACEELDDRQRGLLDSFAERRYLTCYSVTFHGKDGAVPERITVERYVPPNEELTAIQRELRDYVRRETGPESW